MHYIQTQLQIKHNSQGRIREDLASAIPSKVDILVRKK